MWLRIAFLLLVTVIPQACARRDPAVESLIGLEPQRLSFGPPSEVQHSFVEKMRLCWFSGSKPPLAGHRYEAGEREEGESSGGYREVKIFETDAEAPVFEIQFHKYNENTLIVTKNVALSSTLATKVNRDIQLWALAGPDCSS